MSYEYANLAPDFTWYPGAPGRPRNFYAPVAGEQEVVVSIITPTHNPGPAFEETVAAVQGQSLQAWEWLIVDNATTEVEAQTRLAALEAREKRVWVLDLATNAGPAAARNVALEQARGRYVFFLDDDDLIEPTTLEKLAWYLEVHPELAMVKGLSVAFDGQSYHSTISFEAGNLFLERNPVTIMAMVRREALQAVGGFDASLVHGLEDWDLWLKLAAHGYWGGRTPEFLDWYRRRPDHADRWKNWTQSGLEAIREQLKQRYPQLYLQGIPRPRPVEEGLYAPSKVELPFTNRLSKERPRLLFIMPWMAMGGADRFNLGFLKDWTRRGYECTVVTTIDHNYAWYREYARLTPDIFILPYFLPVGHYPRFLDYLITSRQYDVVLLSNSKLGYQMLPYLRARHPEVTYVDYNHMEEEYWENGGHPRRGVAYQEQLDLNLVTSEHLKQWMVTHGGEGDQIDVVYINVDTEYFRPSAELRTAVRARLGIAEDTPLLIYVGRICPQKQPRVFAAVMHELVRAKQRFVCLVLGDGEDLSWLRRSVRRHKLEGQVWLMGAVSSAAMREYLAAADLFLLPSLMEGISLAIYEAMAMGLAVVGADVGGQAELVTPECGVLVQRGTPEEEVARYTAVLRELLEDRERIRRMGQAGRARVEQHFRLEEMGEKMVYELLERAPALHVARPKPVPGLKLSLEHIQLALEEQRLNEALGRLWKYHALETAYTRLAMHSRAVWQRVANSSVGLALKPVKDTLWRVGHHVKTILFQAKDAIWIIGHRVKVMLKLAES